MRNLMCNGQNRPRTGVMLHHCVGSFFLLAFAQLLFLPPASAQGVRLAASRAFVMEGRMEAVAAADFNEDGHLDLVVALTGSSPGDGRIGVALGNGAGEFGAPMILATTPMNPGAANQRKVLAQDLDGDGHVDIVVANDTATTVSLFIGIGDGRFFPRKDLIVGARLFGLAAGDFNRDGKLDLAVIEVARLRLFWGSGSGTDFTFLPGPTLNLNWNGTSVVVADLNGDGWPDILATAARMSTGPSAISELHVFRNTGNGTFTKLAKPGTYWTLRFDAYGKTPMWMVARDLDGDGALDLAIVNRDSNTVVTLKGDGTGNFLLPPLAVGPVGLSPTFLQAGDLDGDGTLDLVTLNRGGNSLSILKGTGTGSFEIIEEIPVGKTPSAVALADLNKDGLLDLFVTHADALSNSVFVLLGVGHGRFDNAPTYATGARPVAVAAADFNKDGHQDLLVVNEGSDTVSFFLGHGDGSFTPALNLPAGQGPKAVVVGHFGRSRHSKEKRHDERFLDFAVANAKDGSVTIYLGGPGLTFTRAADLPVGQSPVHLVAFDSNRDGVLDLAVTNNGSGDIALLLGRGNGSFEAPTYLKPIRSGGGLNRPQGVAVGDFNRDRRVDLVTNSQFFPHLTLFTGNGDGVFTPTGMLDGEATVTRLVALDLNGDGYLDLAASSAASSRNVLVYFGDGRGGFTPGTPYFSGTTMRELAAADLRGFGVSDLVTTNQHFDNFSVLVNNGLGAFAAPMHYAIGADPFGLAVGDFDEDDLPDLAVTSMSANRLSIVLNRTELTRVRLHLDPQVIHVKWPHADRRELRAAVHFADPALVQAVDLTTLRLAGVPARDVRRHGQVLRAEFSVQEILDRLGGLVEDRSQLLILQGNLTDGTGFAGRGQVKFRTHREEPSQPHHTQGRPSPPRR